MSRIIFMGTPAFAVPVLDALTRTNHDIVGVFTRVDKPAGRGGKLAPPPVKQLALTHTLPIFQPKTLRRDESITSVRDLRPDLIVVSAYGLILPRDLLAIPPRGCVNTHASLLPRHRGAAPISAAILAGDSETGVTLMQMDQGIDTGPMVAQSKLPITSGDTTETLTAKLAQIAAALLLEYLPRILAGAVPVQTQDESRATYAKMLQKEQGLIDWHLSADEISRKVRAYNPWPSAYTFWNGTLLKIIGADPLATNPSGEPGTVVQLRQEVAVVCGTGALHLSKVQLAGKRVMEIGEFMRGQREFVGSIVR
jgi:methionyl-tRNA formyltransferase